jgi:hypothetical protein
MRGRNYTIPAVVALATASGNYDLFYLAAADDKPCEFTKFVLGNITEVGDAQEEMASITLRKLTGTVTASSGGAAGAPQPIGGHSVAAGFTSRVGDTAVATQTGGADTEIARWSWNLRNGPCEIFLDESERPRCYQGEALVLRLEIAVADAMDFVGTAYVEEA